MTDKRTQSSPDIIRDLTKKNPLLYGAIFLMLGSQGFDFAGSNAVLQEVKEVNTTVEQIEEKIEVIEQSTTNNSFEISSVQEDVNDLEILTSELEESIETLEDRISNLEFQVSELQTKIVLISNE